MSQHVTPLRYPGGKQRLTPFIKEVIIENDYLGCDYVEPYAGGAGVAMELLVDGSINRVHLNDSSYPVYAFWKCVVCAPEDLCREISRASLTVEEWRKRRDVVRNPAEFDEIEVGFSAFYLNRCNRSGVLSGGLIGGLKQDGRWKMDARFPRNEMIRRIELIASKRDAVNVTNFDAEDYIRDYIPTLPDRSLIYCDPPYFEKSSRLYLNKYNRDDHERIAGFIQDGMVRPWLVSYDAAEEILSYYGDRRKFVYDLQYSASKAYRGKEVFIFSDDMRIPKHSVLTSINEAIQRCVA